MELLGSEAETTEVYKTENSIFTALIHLDNEDKYKYTYNTHEQTSM